jgi:nucleotidyltransferase/DNA polymerase involved in DNA repair
MRQLGDLSGIGKAMLEDLELLGIHSVDQLKDCEPQMLYDELCRRTGQRQDPCVLDTFTCAVAQARNPDLPPEQRNWWYWSRIRKAAASK